MRKKINSKMLDINKKTGNISVRCTKKLEEKTKVKAAQMGESVSEFVSDCIEAGLKRNRRYDKNKARAMVEMQENLNQIIVGLGADQQELRKQMINFMKETMELWEY